MGRERKQRKAALEGDTPSLPCDILCNILSRLPVASLLELRYACKSWYLLISEPHFIKTHLHQSIKFHRHRLLCLPSNIPNYFYYADYEISDDSNYLCLQKKKPKIHCSCNGLVLLSIADDKTCLLWNPSTGAYIELPCPFYFVLCGLCYDSSIDDYKVVLITRPLDSNGQTLYVVFSFKGKSWTEPRKFPYFPIDNIETTPVNLEGLFHFKVLTSSEADRKTYAIVFFDAVNEKFKEVPLPPSICISEMDLFGLMVVRGCLGLYCRTRTWIHYGREVEIWVMKEHGEVNSWTKSMIIPHCLGAGRTCLNIESRNLKLKLVCVSEKGEIVMVIDEKNIALYNPKENEYREIATSLTTIESLYLKGVVSFVESLVLPTIDEEATVYTLRKRQKKGSK